MSDNENDDIPPPPPMDDDSDNDVPPPPPADGDDGDADEQDEEFEKLYQEQHQTLERLRQQQLEQEKQLLELQTQQREQSLRHEQLTKEQQAELERLKKESEKSEQAKSDSMNSDTISKLRASFTKMRDNVSKLTDAFARFDAGLGVSIHDDDVINDLMRQFLLLHPKLISLIMSGAITDDALLKEANELNDIMHGIVSTYKKLERESGGASAGIKQPTRDKLTVSSPAPATKPSPSPLVLTSPAPATSSAASSVAASSPAPTSSAAASPAPKDSIPPAMPGGGRHLTVVVERVRLFDAQQYTNPSMTILVVGKTGRQLESAKDFNSAKRTAALSPHIIPFGFTVTLQHSLVDFHPDSSVIFEIKHFKAKKDKVSTKCWGYFFIDESRDGFFEIPLYQKPTDLKRKNLKLMPVEHSIHPHIALQLMVR